MTLLRTCVAHCIAHCVAQLHVTQQRRHDRESAAEEASRVELHLNRKFKAGDCFRVALFVRAPLVDFWRFPARLEARLAARLKHDCKCKPKETREPLFKSSQVCMWQKFKVAQVEICSFDERQVSLSSLLRLAFRIHFCALQLQCEKARLIVRRSNKQANKKQANKLTNFAEQNIPKTKTK